MDWDEHFEVAGHIAVAGSPVARAVAARRLSTAAPGSAAAELDVDGSDLWFRFDAAQQVGGGAPPSHSALLATCYSTVKSLIGAVGGRTEAGGCNDAVSDRTEAGGCNDAVSDRTEAG